VRGTVPVLPSVSLYDPRSSAPAGLESGRLEVARMLAASKASDRVADHGSASTGTGHSWPR
jgi:hypothetical protein